MAKLFFSYSHADEELRNALEIHLATLKREGLIEAVHDRLIPAGANLDESIDHYLTEADVVLCLLSPDFIASEYCYSVEMARALARHEARECVVIPVVLRHCDWKNTPLAALRGTPRDNKPVRAWADQDEALNNVVQDIRAAITVRRPARAPAEVPAAAERFPQAAENPEEVVRLRSANLAVKRPVTDLDRDKFVARAYELISEVVANSLAELANRNENIETDFRPIDADRFVAAIYRDGNKVSSITVFQGRGGRGAREIGYANNDEGRTNSYNGSYHLSDQDERLTFQRTFGGQSFGGERNLAAETVAEEIWSQLISPLQR